MLPREKKNGIWARARAKTVRQPRDRLTGQPQEPQHSAAVLLTAGGGTDCARRGVQFVLRAPLGVRADKAYRGSVDQPSRASSLHSCGNDRYPKGEDARCGFGRGRMPASRA